MFLGNFERRIDKHGRILIPRKLRNNDSGKAVVIIGCRDHIEVWSKEQWEREQLKIKEALAEVYDGKKMLIM